jgi:Tol biopolymer transport system component
MIMDKLHIVTPSSRASRVQRLLQVLNTAVLYDTASGRDTLLIDLWDTVAPTVARSASKWADLAAIVEAPERWGRLPDGTPAVQVLIDNASNALAGSDSARALAALRTEVAAAPPPASAPIRPLIEAARQRPMFWKVGAALLGVLMLGGGLVALLNSGGQAPTTPSPTPTLSATLTQPPTAPMGGGQPGAGKPPPRAAPVFTASKTLSVQNGIVYGLAFSPDGQTLATAGAGGMIGLWNVSTGQPINTQLGHSGDANSVAFSPKGDVIATGGDDGIVHVWTVTNTTSVRTLTVGPRIITYVAFSPDGQKLVAAAGGGQARLWDVEHDMPLLTLNGDTQTLYSADFSPNGHQVVTAGQDGKVQIWDAGTGVPGWTTPSPGGAIKRAVFSPDGLWVVAGGDDTHGQLWNAATGTAGAKLVGHSDGITSAAFSPDSRLVLTTSKDGTARLWEVGTGTLLQTLSAQNSPVWSGAFSPDKHTLALGSADGLVRLWTTP